MHVSVFKEKLVLAVSSRMLSCRKSPFCTNDLLLNRSENYCSLSRDELLSVCVYKKDINLKLSTHIVVRVALAAFVCSCFFDCIFRVCFLL